MLAVSRPEFFCRFQVCSLRPNSVNYINNFALLLRIVCTFVRMILSALNCLAKSVCRMRCTLINYLLLEVD